MDQINYTYLLVIATVTMLVLYSLTYTYPVLILSGWLLLLYIMSLLYVFIVAPVNQLLVLLYWLVKTPILFMCSFFTKETFDASGLVSQPVGEERYGLRGDLLRRLDISRNYIRPDRHIRLSRSNDIMYESDVPPYMEGLDKCEKVECPKNGYFDKTDTCWRC